MGVLSGFVQMKKGPDGPFFVVKRNCICIQSFSKPGKIDTFSMPVAIFTDARVKPVIAENPRIY